MPARSSPPSTSSTGSRTRRGFRSIRCSMRRAGTFGPSYGWRGSGRRRTRRAWGELATGRLVSRSVGTLVALQAAQPLVEVLQLALDALPEAAELPLHVRGQLEAGDLEGPAAEAHARAAGRRERHPGTLDLAVAHVVDGDLVTWHVVVDGIEDVCRVPHRFPGDARQHIPRPETCLARGTLGVDLEDERAAVSLDAEGLAKLRGRFDEPHPELHGDGVEREARGARCEPGAEQDRRKSERRPAHPRVQTG